MSHAYGQIIKEGIVVGHYEYNGTMDVVLTAIQSSQDEVAKHWRSSGSNKQCTCGLPSDDVVLWSKYGGYPGFWWPGKACFRCMAITGGFTPGGFDGEEQQPQDGYPVHGVQP